MRDLQYLRAKGKTLDLHTVGTQVTQPLPITFPRKMSLIQLRRCCGMTQFEVSRASGVRLCFVDSMERGKHHKQENILRVLQVFSQRLDYSFSINDIVMS